MLIGVRADLQTWNSKDTNATMPTNATHGSRGHKCREENRSPAVPMRGWQGNGRVCRPVLPIFGGCWAAQAGNVCTPSWGRSSRSTTTTAMGSANPFTPGRSIRATGSRASGGARSATAVRYHDRHVAWQRLDMVVDGTVIVENKATESSRPPPGRNSSAISGLPGFGVGVLLHFGPAPRFYRFIDFPKRSAGPIRHHSSNSCSRPLGSPRRQGPDRLHDRFALRGRQCRQSATSPNSGTGPLSGGVVHLASSRARRRCLARSRERCAKHDDRQRHGFGLSRNGEAARAPP